ncbi:hypothetical protein PG999_001800 [Apiospora kogelbergensis]|uniref:Uncharacterized protein n=1 Tax=Apiospora kogelbergensis TaxID=1337665 RepID=A0AAW0R6J8_9PEZI
MVCSDICRAAGPTSCAVLPRPPLGIYPSQYPARRLLVNAAFGANKSETFEAALQPIALLSSFFLLTLLQQESHVTARLIIRMSPHLSRTSFLGASIALIVITTAISGARAIFGIQNGAKIRWDDVWLIAGYVIFMVLSGYHVGKYELMFRVVDVSNGWIPPYEGMEEEGLKLQKLIFLATTGLWLTLWCVKFSLLALYKRMAAQVPLYIRLWWVMTGYCIMMATSTKLSLGFLFGLGGVIVIAATIRAVQIGASEDAAPPPLWLAQWNVIESAISIIVGCGPGLYRKAKAANKTEARYTLEAGNYAQKHDGSRAGRSIKSRVQRGMGNEVPLETYPVTTISASDHPRADGSKEELVRKEPEGQIMVTRSVMSPSTSSNGDLHDEPPSPDQRKLDLTPITPATLPRVTAHPRPVLPALCWSDTAVTPRRKRLPAAINPRLSEGGRAHDRFISPREVTTPLSDRFRSTKEPHELSARERLTRSTAATPDPFRMPPRHDYLALRSRRSSRSDGHRRYPGSTVLALHPTHGASDLERQVSAGSAWSVGGIAPSGGPAVDTGRGQILESGTNAPLHRAPFASGQPRSSEENDSHERRIAHSLDINRAQRVLGFDSFATFPQYKKRSPGRQFIPKLTTTWTGAEWVNDSYASDYLEDADSMPNEPFRVLDASKLRDDYYCSVMAFCPNCDVIAVALGNFVYGWSETCQVSLLSKSVRDGPWVTSLSFSSEAGFNSILACGRTNGTVSLMSLLDSDGANEEPPVFKPVPRFEAQHSRAVASLSWRPVPTTRPSLNPNNPGVPVQTEDLLVGEDVGDVYYYSVEWPSPWEISQDNWRGSMTLLACIKAHSQQICGLAWSPDGAQFATGGNDNICCLYNTKTIVDSEPTDGDGLLDVSTFQWSATSGSSVVSTDSAMDRLGTRDVVNLVVPIRNSRSAPAPSSGSNSYMASLAPVPLRSSILSFSQDDRIQHNIIPAAGTQASINMPKMHSRSAALKVWNHQAAVKALAFCPWRPNLLATGGGSTDKLIHFYHTASGAALATISVSAQVTSLTWSTTRRELAATFGYTQPEHSVRIAVFSWPECTMIGCVRWHGEHRALCAIAYPGGPRGLHSQEVSESSSFSHRPTGAMRTLFSRRRSKSKRDGCLVVAGSDESVKFHEVWGMGTGALSTKLGSGALGGSDILEMEEGIDKEGDVIR